MERLRVEKIEHIYRDGMQYMYSDLLANMFFNDDLDFCTFEFALVCTSNLQLCDDTNRVSYPTTRGCTL